MSSAGVPLYTVRGKDGAILAETTCPLEANATMRRIDAAESWHLPDGTLGATKLRKARTHLVRGRAPFGYVLGQHWGAE